MQVEQLLIERVFEVLEETRFIEVAECLGGEIFKNVVGYLIEKEVFAGEEEDGPQVIVVEQMLLLL